MTVVVAVALLLLIGLLVYLLIGSGEPFDALEAHNKYRKLHGVPPLEADLTITKVASKYAAVLAKNDEMKHSTGSGYGENLFMTTAPQVTAETVVKAWYDEIAKYKFDKPVFSLDTGHFTAVVWRSTKKLGCGSARGAKATYVVCNYYPPGNVKGKFSTNVLPPVKESGAGGAGGAAGGSGAGETKTLEEEEEY